MSDPNTLYARALGHQRQGHDHAAQSDFRAALQHDPRHLPSHLALGMLLANQGQLTEAIGHFKRVSKLAPKDVAGHFNLGNALKQLGDLPKAISSLRQAVKVAPRLPLAHNGLGSALAAAGRLDDAIARYRKALNLDPGFVDAHNNLGVALKENGDTDAAILSYQAALHINPNHLQALCNLGNAHSAKGDHDAAVAVFKTALTLNPNSPDAHYNLANTLVAQAKFAAAEEHFRTALMLQPDHPVRVRSFLFFLTYNPLYSPAKVLQAHQQMARVYDRAAARQPLAAPPLVADPDRPLRIGYLSADLFQHAVAHFFEPLLAHADGKNYPVTCYANVQRPDAKTAELKKMAHHWRDINHLDDHQLAEQIRHDRIDVLIDLGGHSANSRLGAMAYRPAPIQVAYLGYPVSCGLGAVDARITDGWADPPGTEAFYSETLVRLERGFFAYSPRPDAPPVSPAPVLANGHITFGSMINISKLNDTVIALWSRVLTAVPDSELLLYRTGFSAAEQRTRIRQKFAAHGIPETRITLRWHTLDGSDYLGQYAHIDIALDSLPFCGHTTACEAVWMGVPTLTLAGEAFSGRMGVSLNSMLGLTDWIATDADDYLARAQALAADVPALAELRSGLRQRAIDSPVCDGAGLARAVEQAYRRLWQQCCAAPVVS